MLPMLMMLKECLFFLGYVTGRSQFPRAFTRQEEEDCLRRLREEGYTRFYLWAIDGNALADAFYRRHGFRVTGDHIAYATGGQSVRDLRYVRVEDQV